MRGYIRGLFANGEPAVYRDLFDLASFKLASEKSWVSGLMSRMRIRDRLWR